MATTERRIEALETRLAPDDRPVKVLLRDENESEAEALARAGYTADDDVMQIVLVSAPPKSATIGFASLGSAHASA